MWCCSTHAIFSVSTACHTVLFCSNRRECSTLLYFFFVLARETTNTPWMIWTIVITERGVCVRDQVKGHNNKTKPNLLWEEGGEAKKKKYEPGPNFVVFFFLNFLFAPSVIVARWSSFLCMYPPVVSSSWFYHGYFAWTVKSSNKNWIEMAWTRGKM